MNTAASLLLSERLRALLRAASQGLLERETAVRLALLSALAGEHVLLVGPPGTAKSALARRLHAAFAGTRYFERLLTRFSTPEELFGPLSLKALEDDRYERLTEGFLPTAGIAFLDEVFKANSAILNALLTLLNEREFDNGSARVRVPLVAVVAASNEVPADEALLAFYDRFLVRVPVAPVGDGHFDDLLALPELGTLPAVRGAEPLAAREREAIAAAAAAVALGDSFIEACRALRAHLAGHDAALSDRRWRQIVRLTRTAAASEGRVELDRLDLWLAPYVASRTPADVPALARWFEDEVLGLPAPAAPWIERAVQAFERQLEIERSAPAEGDEAGLGAGKLALARAIGRPGGGATPDDDAPPGLARIVSARLEAERARRWSPVHVAARVAQVLELEQRLAEERARQASSGAALRAALAGRLWVPDSSHGGWLGRWQTSIGVLDGLLARLAAARAGFASLPLRAQVPADAGPVPSDGDLPPPVRWAEDIGNPVTPA